MDEYKEGGGNPGQRSRGSAMRGSRDALSGGGNRSRKKVQVQIATPDDGIGRGKLSMFSSQSESVLSPSSASSYSTIGVGGSFVNSMTRETRSRLSSTGMSRDKGSRSSTAYSEDFQELPPLYPPRSPGGMGMPTSVLYAMSYQNAFASRTIQRNWRGYSARINMWCWNGVMLNRRALKIQRAWRGRKGRKRALLKAKQRLSDIANRIKGQYFIWQAKRTLRVLRAEKMEINVIKIQCLYRTRLARSYVARARKIHHTRMTLRIQAVVRGKLGRLRYWGMKKRLRAVFDRMTQVMMRDIRQSQARIKPTMENLISGTDRSSPWALLESIFFQVIGTMRRDIAVDLSAELLRKHSSFYYGRFAMQVALFLTWTCSGSTNHVRMDMLDELVGCLYYNQAVFGQEEDYMNIEYGRKDENRSPESLADRLPTRYGWWDELAGSMHEFEFMYFRNSFLRHGKSAHSMTVMAACILMQTPISNYGKERTPAQLRQLDRAKRLLSNASDISTNNIEECKARIDIADNIFCRAHRLLLQGTVTFNGLRLLGFKAFSMIHKSQAMALKDMISLDIEVVQAGGIVIVRGYLRKLPLPQSALDKLRAHNNIPALGVDEDGEATGVDIAPKWVSYRQNYDQVAKERLAMLRAIEKGGNNSPIPMRDKKIRNATSTGDDDDNVSVGSLDSASVASMGPDGHAEPLQPPPLVVKNRTGTTGTSGSATSVNSSGSARSNRTPIPDAVELEPPILVVRPLVLSQKETIDMGELALQKTAVERGVDVDVIRAEGAIATLAEYLLKQVRVTTCRSRLALSADSAEAVSLKLTLPQLEYRRLEQNNARTVEFSVKLIQRIYRGSRGKCRFKRMWFRNVQKNKQISELNQKRAIFAEVRDNRYKVISKIQAAVKAWSWRRLMARMRRAALIVQCRFRMFRAKNRVDEERRRRSMGPEVLEMTRRSVKFGELYFTLLVYRCGFQYRLRGYNLLTNEIYEGNVFQQEVQQMCEDFNATIVGTTLADERKKISPWSYHKVVEMLISNMGLAEVMPPVTATLGGMPETAKKRYVLVMKPYATKETPGLSKIKHLKRLLKDTCTIVDKYEKMLAREEKLRRQGLLPPKPKLKLSDLREKTAQEKEDEKQEKKELAKLIEIQRRKDVVEARGGGATSTGKEAGKSKK